LRDYYLWPADDWSSAPKREPTLETATQPPVAADWYSPFRGKTIKDLVAFMKTLPEERYIDYHHFCVLGKDFEKRKLITIYRIGDENLVGDELDSLPCSVAGKCLLVPFAMQRAHEMNPKARLIFCWDWSRVPGRKSRTSILKESPWADICE
jgi:hypothetical protein